MITIKAAAIIDKNGKIWTRKPPHRHPDILLYGEECGENIYGGIQGFVTSDGKFVDRAEAYKIAKNANQIIYPPGGTPTPGTLYTEDLW